MPQHSVFWDVGQRLDYGGTGQGTCIAIRWGSTFIARDALGPLLAALLSSTAHVQDTLKGAY